MVLFLITAVTRLRQTIACLLTEPRQVSSPLFFLPQPCLPRLSQLESPPPSPPDMALLSQHSTCRRGLSACGAACEGLLCTPGLSAVTSEIRRAGGQPWAPFSLGFLMVPPRPWVVLPKHPLAGALCMSSHCIVAATLKGCCQSLRCTGEGLRFGGLPDRQWWEEFQPGFCAAAAFAVFPVLTWIRLLPCASGDASEAHPGVS